MKFSFSKKAVIAPLVALAVSASVTSLFLVCMGESPSILVEAFTSTFFNSFGLGYTLYYTTPLILTGLSVALSFHAGLFNIGSEGQLHLGAIAIVALSCFSPNLPSFLAVPLGVLVALIFGGIWGMIAGYFKAKRGSHEVIVTILLNFIGIILVNYLILYPFKNTEVQNPETVEIGKGYVLPLLSDFTTLLGSDFFLTTPVNITLFLSIIAAILCYLFLFHTSKGYEIRALGQNPTAAEFNGIAVGANFILVLTLSGALSGLVGVNEVMGYHHKLIEGFSPQYGFTGIAVALIARNHPLGIILSALLFGAIHNGAREIEFLSEKMTKEVSVIMEALIIIIIASQPYFVRLFSKSKKEGAK